MILLEDTRNQVTKHKTKNKYFSENGIEVRRTKLYVGDYTLPTNQSICIDTKKDIQELIGDICGKSHERFRDELIRAQESNIKLIIFVVKEVEAESEEEAIDKVMNECDGYLSLCYQCMYEENISDNPQLIEDEVSAELS